MRGSRGPSPRAVPAPLPAVSVVVPVFNEEVLLPGCLHALQQQDYRGPWEIVVVDNGSTDGSAAVARAFGVRLVSEPRKGYVHALRAGFAAARGEIIACTDADSRVPADWLSRMVTRLLREPGTVAVSGVFDLMDAPPALALAGRVLSRLNWHLAGGNMAVWRRAYEAVGGFDPAVNLGADTHLGLRLRRLGRVAIDRRLAVSTSARRFQQALWPTLARYLLNDLWLVCWGRPCFYDFPDVRYLSPPGQAWAGWTTPTLALTFDDGPSPWTAQVLDILARHGVQATFFVIGQNVERHPELVRRMVAEGHLVGVHSYSHPFWLAWSSSRRIARELDRTAEAIWRAAGVWPTFFRPPHGWQSPRLNRLARERGYTVVTWTVCSGDWRGLPAGRVVERVLRGAASGAIVLLHDGLGTRPDPPMSNTVAALPRLLEQLQARGYRLVSLDRLTGAGVGAALLPAAVAPRPGETGG